METERKRKQSGITGKKALYAGGCALLLSALTLFFLFFGKNKAYAVEMPSDYALNFSETLGALGTDGEYGDIKYEGESDGKKTFLLTGEGGFVTLARVSQTTDFADCIFRVPALTEVELTIRFDDAGNAVSEGSFFGIGNETHPFRGAIVVQPGAGDTYLRMAYRNVLFNAMSNEASLTAASTNRLRVHRDAPFALCDRLIVTADGTPTDISGFAFAATEAGDTGVVGEVTAKGTAGLVAARVSGGALSLDLTTSFSASSGYGITSTSGNAGGLFGEIGAGTSVTVTLGGAFRADVSAKENAGILVGVNSGNFTVRTEEGTTLSLSGSAVSESTAGAVGVIGVNDAGAEVLFSSAAELTQTGTSFDGSFAGGILGVGGEGSTLGFDGDVTLSGLSLSGTCLGGVVGSLQGGTLRVASGAVCRVSDSTWTSSGTSFSGGAVGLSDTAPIGAFTLSGNTFTGGGSAGGFVGSLTVGTEARFDAVDVISSTFDRTGGGNDDAVGLVFGMLSANAPVTYLSDAVSSLSLRNATDGVLGGVIGRLSASSLTAGVTVGGATGNFGVTTDFGSGNFSGTFGGVVGALGESACLRVHRVSVTDRLTARRAGMADLCGRAANGAVLDVGDFLFSDTASSALVYSTGEGTVLRLFGALSDTSATADHIVVRQDASLLFADEGFSYTFGGTARGNDVGNYGQIFADFRLGIFDFSDPTHTVTVSSPLPFSGGALSLGSREDAAKLAVTLLTKGRVTGVAGIGTQNYRTLLSADITMTADVDLRGSGVEQFTAANAADAFTGVFDGGSHTLTLAFGESLDGMVTGILSPDNERYRLGAFSAVSGATVRHLTLAGAFGYFADVVAGRDVLIGSFAGYAADTLTVSDCTVTTDVTLSGGNIGDGGAVYVGGLFGKGEHLTLSVTGSVIAPSFTHAGGYDGDVYLGGIAAAVSASGNASLTDNRISTVTVQSTWRQSAHVGGCIADFSSDGYVTLDLSGTRGEGILSDLNCKVPGGMLGYRYTGCRILLDSVWQGSVTTKDNPDTMGGLLTFLEGKMTLEDGFSFGGDAQGASSFSAAGTSIAGRGAVIGDGTAAFLTVRCGADAFSASVLSADGFDLLVGRNIYDSSTVGIASTGGLVSIETGEGNTADGIGKIPVSSDWHALIGAHSNTATRYYFNVAAFDREVGGYSCTFNATGIVVSRPADLIYWNLIDFVSPTLPSYVRQASFPDAADSVGGADADVNLSGYCFYPTKKEACVFDFGGKTLTFGDAVASAGQFFGLQCGVISDVIVTEPAASTILFRRVRLAGVLSAPGNGSGAMICGTVRGRRDTGVTAEAKVTAEDVFFYGIRVAGAGAGVYRPLLLNRTGSNVTLTLRRLSQYSEETYTAADKDTLYTPGVPAASSLIGYVGTVGSDGTPSSYLSVTFESIVFAGRASETVFTEATLIREINCVNGAGTFTYNFNRGEDWSGGSHVNAVTYGAELYTNEAQRQYFDSDYYISPDSAVAGSPYESFGTLYLVFVLNNGEHLSINRKGVDFDEGFGTYEHPYVLRTADHLLYLSRLLQGTKPADGWTVNLPQGTVSAPDYTSYLTYTASGGTLGATGADGAVTRTTENLLAWLRQAYYRIPEKSLTLPDGFAGIGTTANPFHGVIVGNGTEITMPDYGKIVNTGFCGFIGVANGCAVYGLTLRYGNVTLSGTGFGTVGTTIPFQKTSDALPTGEPKTDATHFGGVIGWVIGGDNLIENVTVSVGTVGKGYRASVFGGYVGLISGGGVNVRRIGTFTLPGDGYETYTYYNPYVGKVLAGYFISNDGTYDNTEKGYTVPTISEDVLTAKSAGRWTGGVFRLDLATAEDLLLFAVATNDGSLIYGASQSVGFGSGAFSRFGSYGAVGTEGASGVADGRYTEDTAVGTDGKQSLLASRFGMNMSDWRNSEFYLALTGTRYDLTPYGNAFRGIGSGIGGRGCFNIKTVSGETGGAVILFDSTLTQYYNGSTPEPDAVYNLALVIERKGTGNGITFSGITLGGTLALDYRNLDGTSATARFTGSAFCVGGFLGYARNAMFYDVGLDHLTVRSPGWAGGLVGSEEYDAYLPAVALQRCTVDTLTVEGFQSVGGLFGYLRLHADAEKIRLETITVENSVIRIFTTANNTYNQNNNNTAAGGLIGLCLNNRKMKISHVTVTGTAVLCLSSSATSNTGNINAGGLVGRTSSALIFDDCTVDGCTVAASAAAAWGDGFAFDYTKKSNLTGAVYDKVANIVAYALSATAKRPDGNAGGFVGYSDAALTFTSSKVRSDAATTVIFGSCDVGGFLCVGAPSGETTFTGAQVAAGAHPLYLLGKSTAAALCSWNTPISGTSAVYRATDCRIAGSASYPVFLLSLGERGTVAGAFGNIRNATIGISSLVISDCVIAGDEAAGVISEMEGSTLTVKDLTLTENFLQAYAFSAAGVVNGAKNTVTVEGMYFGENVLRHAGAKEKTAFFAEYSNATVSLYWILTYHNDVGYSDAADRVAYEDIFAARSPGELKRSGTSYDRVALFVYNNDGGTLTALGVSCMEDAALFAGKNTLTGSGTASALFGAYGAPAKYREMYRNGTPIGAKEALDVMTATVTVTGGDTGLSGDAVTRTDGSYTADFLGDGTSLPWWGILSGTAVASPSDLSALLAGTLANNGTLPVFSVNGNTDGTVGALLALLTRGGAEDSAFTVTATSVRYRVESDGTLTSLGTAGSVRYDGKSKKFVAGVYDNLAQDAKEKSLSVLTVTFSTDADHAYSMDIVIYYPQILEIKSYITAMEGEVYRLSSFLTNPAFEKVLSAGSKFTLYLEYAYNKAVYNIEDFNFAKRIASGTRDGAQEGQAGTFLAGTSFVMIDLNTPEAYGYRYYFYTMQEDGRYVDLGLFENGDIFLPKNLSDLIRNMLGDGEHLCTDSDYTVYERYLLVVIPSGKESGLTQFNLRAGVKENDRNIIVRSEENLCSVSVWGRAATGSLGMDSRQDIFSNLEDGKLTADVTLEERFPDGYAEAMYERTFYGTHVFRLKNSSNGYVSLPAGTEILLTDAEGNVRMSYRVTAPVSSFRYSLDIAMKNADLANSRYCDSFTVTLDFSAVGAKEFNATFRDADRRYTLQDEFYFSGDREHYLGGSKMSAEKMYTTKPAATVLVTVTPEDSKHLAVNLNPAEAQDKTNDGIIDFRLVADFGAVPDVTLTGAKTEFFLYRKKYDAATGKHAYDETDSLCGEGLFGKVVNRDGTAFSGALTLTEGVATGDLRLVLDLLDPALSNYRLVVRMTGIDADGRETSHTAEAYFVFLLCNIGTDPDL